jgi:hypothetical protein
MKGARRCLYSSVLLLNVVAHIYSGPPRFHLYQKTQETINATGSPQLFFKHTCLFCSKKQKYGKGWMANSSNTNKGIRLLIKKYRNEFRRPENIYYYTENDFKAAEKRFVKFCLTGRPNSNSG